MSKKPRPKSSTRSPKSSDAQKKQEEPSLPEKVQEQQAEYDKWSQAALDPSLSPAAAQFARNVARSQRAALQLGQKALLYQQEEQQDQKNTPSLPDQPPTISPTTGIPETSI